MDKLTSETGQRLDGHIVYTPSEIRTDTEMGEQRETQVLWHEIIHGVADLYGVELKEKEVEQISNGVMDVIRHNSWLIERTMK